MNWIVAQVKWIMLVSGALTCTMVYAAIDPQTALKSNFGEGLDGPVAEIVVRNWGALIALIGVMLIAGAFNPANRKLALSIAGLSKLVFIGLVLTYGQAFMSHQVGVAVIVDGVMVVLYALCLLGLREQKASL